MKTSALYIIAGVVDRLVNRVHVLEFIAVK